MNKHKKIWCILSVLFVILLVVLGVLFAFTIHTSDSKPVQTETKTETEKYYKVDEDKTLKAVYDDSNRLIKVDWLDILDITPKLYKPIQAPLLTPLPTEKPEPTPEPVEEIRTALEGTFTLTHYCSCERCNGKWTNQPTASGRMPEDGVTVAVDPNVIPLGTRLRIAVPCDGGELAVYRDNARADDTGSSIKGNKIDVYVADHEEAIRLGVIKNAKVYILGGN